MKNKIYFLQSDVTNFCSFIQSYPNGDKSIIGQAMAQCWKPFDGNYESIVLELRRNDAGRKNYQFDFSSSLNPSLLSPSQY